MPDLVIRAGLVLDGSGAPPQTADIAVRDGLIAEIGRVRDRAHRVIDADGALVVPGLCALMPPSDVARFDRNRSAHRAPGVTTAIETVTRDEAAQSQLPDYLAGADDMVLILDRAVLIDHGQMRREVMGNKVRDQVEASDGDVESMGSILAAAIAAGVVGIRSSVEGDPGELTRALLLANAERQAETGEDPQYSLLLAGRSEPRELLDVARHLNRALAPRSTVVCGSEPFSDDGLITAVVPGSEDDPAALFAEDRTMAGPGINPLGLLSSVSDDEFPLARLGLCWARGFDAFGLTDRGRIRSDLRADINVLDHVHLSDDLGSGVVSTMVAGVEIASNDELTGAAPGQLAVATSG